MYINFWYPVCTSADLGENKPVPVRILGLRFVAFRDTSGAAHVLSDTCAHRGGSLSKGTVKDDCVVCPYHGWRYRGDGTCQTIPSLAEGQKPPARAKVDSYPVQEKYGIVHAFLGDLPEEERPPLYEIEEYGKDGWRESEIMLLNIACYYERSMENGLDPIHNEFVHPLQGAPSPQADTLQVTDVPWGTGVIGKYGEKAEKPNEQNLEALESDPDELNASSWTHGPNTLITWIQFSKDSSLHQYFFEAPVDENHTKIYFINLRNAMLDEEYDEKFRVANLQITYEDIGILEELYPVRTPETNTREVMTPGDRAIVRFRELLKTWEGNGWRLDRRAMREAEGDIAFAIPCPARRESGNWVLDPVPLVPGE